MSPRTGALESPAWMPRRPGAAAAALALNVALGIALILSFRTSPAPISGEVVSRLIWLPAPAARPKRPNPPKSKRPPSVASRSRARAETLSPIMPSVAPIAGTRAPVDWWGEAERVVRERSRAATDRPDDGRIDLHLESRSEAPAHYAGESYRDELGNKIVWVSEKCYIESDPPPLGTPPAFEHATSTRTVCPGNSNTPRGDLFKDLPEYRKYAPK
ncbi:MAG TPA: hypothetical protein VN730_07340 [Steroidobacteraceae bacterium]|nr:hypothetical protein [Steroidobacteraceae bacterium]